MLKVKKMCELVRQHLPQAQIVVGGHVANIPDLDQPDRRRPHRPRRRRALVPRASWARTRTGPSATRRSLTRIGTRILGEPLPENPRDVAATLIPSVGCPHGLQLLLHLGDVRRQGEVRSTSSRRGDELFDIMCQLEESHEGPVVLRHGRELPAGPPAGRCGCWS